MIHEHQHFLWDNNKKLLPFGAYRDLITQPLTQPWDGDSGFLSARRWQRKAWLFVNVCNADFYAGIAICDAGYLGKPFVYIYDVKNKILLEDGASVPFAFNKNEDWTLKSDWKIKNYHIYAVDNQIIAKYKGKKFQLTITIDNNHNGLSFVCPSKNRPFHFTYKNEALPAQVEFTYKGVTQRCHTVLGGIDFSKGYPPRHTTWNWTSFMGQTTDGTKVGINLVDKFNDNIENALWLGNEQSLLGSVKYEYAQASEKNAWRVFNDNLEIVMPNPLGARRENVNAIFLKSKFIQVFGVMSGKIKVNNIWTNIEGFGVMEEHEAKW